MKVGLDINGKITLGGKPLKIGNNYPEEISTIEGNQGGDNLALLTQKISISIGNIIDINLETLREQIFKGKICMRRGINIAKWLFLFLGYTDPEDPYDNQREQLFNWFNKIINKIINLPNIQNYVDIILFSNNSSPNSEKQIIDRFYNLKTFLELHFKNELNI